MKRSLALVLSIISIMLILSCSLEINDLSSDLVKIRFGRDTSRSLYANNETFDESSYVWYYTAVKANSSSPSYGTVSALTIIGESGNIDEEVGPFSQGYWVFSLYGFNTSTSENEITKENAVYSGSSTVLVEKSNSTQNVSIAVSAVLSDSVGTLVFDNAYFTWPSDTTTDNTNEPTVTITLTVIGDTNPSYILTNAETDTSTVIKIELSTTTEDSTKYYISFANSDNVAVSRVSIDANYYTAEVQVSYDSTSLIEPYTFFLRVYGNQTTTITGDITS